jgi:hypothetical protein
MWVRLMGFVRIVIGFHASRGDPCPNLRLCPQHTGAHALVKTLGEAGLFEVRMGDSHNDMAEFRRLELHRIQNLDSKDGLKELLSFLRRHPRSQMWICRQMAVDIACAPWTL